MPLQPAVLGPNLRLNNFRLNYLTAAQAADRPTHIRILLDGIDITKPNAPVRVIYKSLTIRDALFETPNTCGLTLYGAAAPHVGQPIEVWINSNAPTLLFGGELQTVDRTYKGRPSTVLHPVTAIDDTARANRRRPLMRFVNVSATTIAQTLMTAYVPGFSSAGVEAGLPAVTVTFDGSEAGMKGCLTALAKLVGAYWYFENKTLYFFITPPGNPPDPIDDTPGRFLHEPQITWSIDKSQVRTRVYGKGAGTQISTGIAAGEALVPIVNGEMFNTAGGQAIAAVTPDGAAYQVLTYTGVQLGGGGGLVGPGAAPSAAPGLTPIDGTGVESGTHAYAVTFTTAAGESLPGPVGTVNVGVMIPPAAPPLPGAVRTGGAIEPETYSYAVTFVTAIGETTAIGGSAGVTTTIGGHDVPDPTTKIAAQNVSFAGHLDYPAGSVMTFRYAYETAAGVTTAAPLSNAVTAVTDPTYGAPYVKGIELALVPSTDPGVTHTRIYQYRNGAFQGSYVIPPTMATTIDGQETLAAIPPSGTNSAHVPGTNYQTVPLTGILTGPPNVTARRIYRWSATSGWKRVTTIANNTATTYTDAAASTSLTGTLPVTNTAAANWVQVFIPIGGSGVTGRKVYRSAANQTALKFLAALAGDNVTTNFPDGVPDASLGAAPPVSDTSGLVQPNGQVPAGATTLILANPTAFAAGGGWAVVGNGEQVIRYTGKTTTALTGIPATGPGAIVASISYNSTVTAAAALMGVNGLIAAVIRNSPIHVWIQRDDLAAQAAMITLDGGGDGVYEHIWSDERRSEPSLIQVCDAQLALYSRPLVTVTYASRDQKTKSGKTVTVNLATPAIAESLTIQDVTISELGVKGLAPKFTVTASTVRQSFEAILQSLIRKADS